MDAKSDTAVLATILSTFWLDGETLMLRTGGEAKVYTNKKQGRRVVTFKHGPRWKTVSLARCKYAVHHKALPPMVDHEDRDASNDRLANLRPATRKQNARNRSSQRGLPKGVYVSGKGFKVLIKLNGAVNYLGYFTDPEAAGATADAFRKANHGEFYAKP